MENIEKLTYTRREAAAALGVSLPTIDAFMHRRDNPLPYIRKGPRCILIPRATLETWVQEEAVRNAGTSAACYTVATPRR